MLRANMKALAGGIERWWWILKIFWGWRSTSEAKKKFAFLA